MNIECPSCGAPAPLSTASPDELRCPSCGFVGPMPEEARDALRRGAELVRALDAKKLQLGGLARRSVLNARFHVIVVALASLIFGLPVALSVVGCLSSNFFSSTAGIEFRLICTLPIVLYLVTTVMGALWLGRVRKKLVAATAATPPQVAGAPARCRVCGAPLAASADLIVRCEHCRADNLVSPAAFIAASARRAGQLGEIEVAVQRSSTALGSITRQVVFALIVTVVCAPVLTFAVLVCAVMNIGDIEGEIDESARFVISDTPGGRCIGAVGLYPGSDDPVWISFGGRESDGYLPAISRQNTDGLELLRVRDLVGLRVREYVEPHREGTIVRVHGTRAGVNHVVLRPSRQSIDPAGLCIVP